MPVSPVRAWQSADTDTAVMDNRALLRQFLLTFLVTFAAILALLKSGLLSYVAYSVEKGRLRAMHESLPSAEELAKASLPARDVARMVSPAVVYIEATAPPVTSWVGTPLEGRFRELEEEAESPEELAERRRLLQEHLDRMTRRSSVGSGFITDAEHGFILTNYHVVEGAERIEVHLPDGRPPCLAEVVGADPLTDLAVIRIQADRLYQVTFGNSDRAEVGDPVFALGSPFGLTGTVSRGIISGKGRHSVDIGGAVYQGFLQTDAVINPGNSGGPLVNMRGEVIGVNTAIATQTGHYDGVGFAIPSTRVAEVLPKLIRGEPIERAFLGILPVSVTEQPERARAAGWTENYGVLVREVVAGTVADEAGLQRGDIIVRIDGVRMESAYHLVETIGQMLPGAVIALDIYRDGRRMIVEATLGRRPDG